MSKLAEITARDHFSAAVVLGSGLSPVAEALVAEGSAGFGEVSGLLPATVEGHDGRVHWGEV